MAPPGTALSTCSSTGVPPSSLRISALVSFVVKSPCRKREPGTCTRHAPTSCLRSGRETVHVSCIRGGAYRRHRQEVDGERVDLMLDENLRPRARRRAELEGAHPGPQQPELLVQLVQLEVGA